MSTILGTIARRAAAAAGTASSNTTSSGSSGSLGSTGSIAAAKTADPGPSNLQIVWGVDVLLLSLIALLFVFRLPRFLARLYSLSEWTTGLVLRNKPYHKRTTGRRVQFSMGNSSMDDISIASDLYGEKVPVQREPEVKGSYPPHVLNHVASLRPMLRLMHARVNTGVSFSHVLVMAIWLGAVVFPAFYMTNAFTDPERFGFIAASQLPFVYAFGTKNNIFGMFLGIGYEKINFMHRHSGRIAVVAVNVHSLGYIYKWGIAKNFMEKIAQPKCYWGLIGLICMDGLFLLSIEFVRKKAYNLFLFAHISSLTVLVISMLYHYKGTWPWAYACAGFYLLDILLRTFKTRVSTANIRPVPELGITRVEVPNINSGWRAGQHVRLRVISSGMGLIGWSEVHPFTIASVANSPEGLVLYCKKAGDWTNKLYNMASSSSGEDGARKVSVIVQGPYGGLGNCMVSSFSAAVFICGGSGITLATSIMQELIQKDLDGESRVKSIHLIWTIQDPSALSPMLPLFTSMIQQSVFTPVQISVFYTRAPTGKPPFTDDFFRSTSLTLSPGRPKIHKHLEQTISGTTYLNSDPKGGSANGLFVGVCGPVALADSVFVEAGKIDAYRRDQIGGVEVHAETFGW